MEPSDNVAPSKQTIVVPRVAEPYVPLVQRPLERELLVQLVNEATQRLDSEHEQKIGQTVQRRLLPAKAPAVPEYEIAAASYPASYLSGDYYDYIPLDDGSLLLVLGDASGHGIGAALLVTEVRAYVRAFARVHSEPAKILHLVNQSLCDDLLDDHFVTLLIVRLYPADGSLVYASAGHPPAWLFNRPNYQQTALASLALPLGIERTQKIVESDPIALHHGGVLVLYTDGLSESRCQEELHQTARLLHTTVAAAAHKPAMDVLQDLRAAAATRHPNVQPDDVTLMVVRRPIGA